MSDYVLFLVLLPRGAFALAVPSSGVSVPLFHVSAGEHTLQFQVLVQISPH